MAKAARIVEVAEPHVGEAYVLGAMAPKNNPNWTGPWDCAEFASWCVFQAAKTLFGCEKDDGDPARASAFTGFWQRDAKKPGCSVPVSVAAATAGAFVLRFPQPNLVGHIAICDGKGGTVEAHSSKAGVIRGKISGRRWDIGVLVAGVNYADLPQTPAEHIEAIKPVSWPGLVLRLKDPMMRGELVRKVQERLTEGGCHPGKIDGKFGAKTMAAVAAFQLTKGLAPDGEVGPLTLKMLGIKRA